MTQFMTRRERREAERAGLIPTSNPVVETATTSEVEVVEQVVVDVPVEPEVIGTRTRFFLVGCAEAGVNGRPAEYGFYRSFFTVYPYP